jgi:DNA primase
MTADRRFPDSLLDDIRARVSLVTLIGRDIRLTRQGREHAGLCPFHSERSPSFTVSEEKGFFHCFGCGAHGDAFGYLTMRGRSFIEAVTELADMAGVAVEGRRPSAPLAPMVTRLSPEDVEAEQAEDIDKARALWASTVEGRGSIVEVYLRDGRGLDLDAIGGVPACLRLAGRLDYWARAKGGGELRVVWSGPAMVAPLVTPDRRIIGVHRTWLLPDGSDRLRQAEGMALKGKKMLGTHSGAVIPLAGRAARMQGGEGIETSLSGWCAVPGLPAVCLGSLGNFSGRKDGSGGWSPWPGLADFTWLEDADGKDPADMRGKVERGMRRLVAAGVTARRAMPPQGMDMNDLYRRRG